MNKERPIDLQSIYDQVRSYYELDNDFDIESILDPIYTFLLLPQLYLAKINVAMELNHRKIVKYSIHLC